MTKQVKKRIYVVAGKRLVRASTNLSARNHVAKDTITSELATQDKLIELLGSGAKVEETESGPVQSDIEEQIAKTENTGGAVM